MDGENDRAVLGACDVVQILDHVEGARGVQSGGRLVQEPGQVRVTKIRVSCRLIVSRSG